MLNGFRQVPVLCTPEHPTTLVGANDESCNSPNRNFAETVQDTPSQTTSNHILVEDEVQLPRDSAGHSAPNNLQSHVSVDNEVQLARDSAGHSAPNNLQIPHVSVDFMKLNNCRRKFYRQ